MADTPTPPDPNKIDDSQNALERLSKSLEHVADVLSHRFGDAVSGAQRQLGLMTDGTSTAQFMMDKLGLATGKASDAFKVFQDQTSKLTDGSKTSTQALSALTLGAIGAGKAFQTVSSINFDNLNTFTSQINSMVDTIGNDLTALGKLEKALGFVVPDAVKGTAKAFGDAIKNIAAGADEAMRAERAYVALGASTGDLGKLHDMTGDALKNLGERTLQHSKIIDGANRATINNRQTMESYYALLGRVPGALENNNMAQTTLLKTTLLSMGTGRDYKDIVDDVHMAIREYSASIPEAIKFTEQISAISETYGVELKDVDDSLKTTAQSLRMFGAGAQGAQNILINYLGTLREMKLSGAVSTDILTNMTGQIEKMSMATKSFLSAQSGGPGGLMGAAHIDRLLQQGKVDEVFEMVRKQLTRQMGGRLVSVEEAEKSPQAAAQLARQNVMLRQGPLGQFARSDQEAERITEMFSSQRGGRVDPATLEKITKTSSDYTKLGTEYAKQSSSELARIRGLLEESRALAGFGALDLAGKFTNARDLPGSTPEFMERGQQRGMGAVQDLATMDRTGVSLDTLPKSILDEMREYEDAMKDVKEKFVQLKQDMNLAPVGPTTIQEDQKRRGATAGTQLRSAAAGVSTRTVEPTPTGTPAAGVTPGTTSTLTAGPAGSFILHNRIEGLCINCGVEMQGNENQFSVNTAGRTQQRGP